MGLRQELWEPEEMQLDSLQSAPARDQLCLGNAAQFSKKGMMAWL